MQGRCVACTDSASVTMADGVHECIGTVWNQHAHWRMEYEQTVAALPLHPCCMTQRLYVVGHSWEGQEILTDILRRMGVGREILENPRAKLC